MNRQDAAAVGMYAAELFRYVTTGQQTAVAELMLPVPDVEDEIGNCMQAAVEVGKGLLRTLAASAKDEQRLHLTDVAQAVNEHLRRVGVVVRDVEKDKRTVEREATIAARRDDDDAIKWATGLPAVEAERLMAEVLTQLPMAIHHLFAGKTLATSKTLRMLAMEHHRKATAFD